MNNDSSQLTFSFTGFVIGGGYTDVDATETNNVEYFLPANPQVSSQCVLPPLTDDGGYASGNLPTFSVVQDSLVVCQSRQCSTLQDNTWVFLANLTYPIRSQHKYFHAVFGGNILRFSGQGFSPITTEVIDTTTFTSSSVSIDWINNYTRIFCVSQVGDSVVIYFDVGDVFTFTYMNGGGNVQLPSTTFTSGADICGHYDHVDGSKVNKKPI